MATANGKQVDVDFLRTRYEQMNAAKKEIEDKKRNKRSKKEAAKDKYRKMGIKVTSDEKDIDRTIFEKVKRKARPVQMDKKIKNALKWKGSSEEKSTSEKTREDPYDQIREKRMDKMREKRRGGNRSEVEKKLSREKDKAERGMRTHGRRRQKEKKSANQTVESHFLTPPDPNNPESEFILAPTQLDSEREGRSEAETAGKKTERAVKTEEAAGMKTEPVVKTEETIRMKTAPAVKTEEAVGVKTEPAVKTEETIRMKTVPAVKPEETAGVNTEPAVKTEGTTGMKTEPAVKTEEIDCQRKALIRFVLETACSERLYEKAALSPKDNEALALFFAGKLACDDQVLHLLDSAFDRVLLVCIARESFRQMPGADVCLVDRHSFKTGMLDILLSDPKLLPETWKETYKAAQEQHRRQTSSISLYDVLFSYPQQISIGQKIDKETGLPVVSEHRNLFWGAIFGPSDSRTFQQTAQAHRAKQKVFKPIFEEKNK